MPDPAATEFLVKAVDVRRSFGRVVALDGVDLSVGEGGIVGLLGPNGAGKTTLLSLLLGLRRLDSGRVTLFGGDPRDPANRTRLGSTPQETGLPSTLRVSEVVNFVARHYPDPIPTKELLSSFGLLEERRRQTGALSGGQKRRLAVALAMVGRPRLLVLDEPTTGLDVDARHTLWQAVREFSAAGGTVLVTSHYLEEIETLARRVVVIGSGRVLADGPMDEVRSSVSQRRLALTAAHLPELGSVLRSSRDGDRWQLYAADSDAVVRELVGCDVDFRNLEVAPASLEEAFLALTAAPLTQKVPA